MDDDTRFKDLTLPEDEPWMSHGFISKIAAQVSLPYRKPKGGVKEIERRNGSLVVRYVSGADRLPYGKYPRLFELWACTMIKTDDPCFDPETNTLHLGTTFREFLRLIGVNVGGKSLHTIKPQLERLFKCVYIISNNTETTSQGINFTVAEKYQIDWLRNEPQSHGLFENWVQLSQRYVDMLRDHPVPVDLWGHQRSKVQIHGASELIQAQFSRVKIRMPMMDHEEQNQRTGPMAQKHQRVD